MRDSRTSCHIADTFLEGRKDNTLSPQRLTFSAGCAACQKLGARPSNPFTSRLPSGRHIGERHPTSAQYRSDHAWSGERASEVTDGEKRNTECGRAKTGRMDRPVCGLTCHRQGERREAQSPMELLEKTTKGSKLIRSRLSGSASRTEGKVEGRIGEKCILPRPQPQAARNFPLADVSVRQHRGWGISPFLLHVCAIWDRRDFYPDSYCQR